MAVLISIALIVVDQKVAMFQPVRSALSLVALPFQYAVSAPVRLVQWATESATVQRDLVIENARLRAHELLLEARLQRLSALEQENRELRGLLKSASKVQGKTQAAELLAVSLQPDIEEVIIDAGQTKNAYVGQPVLDAYGVVGEIVDVGPLSSKVMLISDPKSAVPVQDDRSGVRAIVVGLGSSGTLQLINVPDRSDIKVGDPFVSSGLGLRYPAGYPVGIVLKIEVDAHQKQTIILQPSAHLNRDQQVLMVWPTDSALVKAVQDQLVAPIPAL